MRHPLKAETIERLSQDQPTPDLPESDRATIRHVARLIALWTIHHSQAAYEELKQYPQYFKIGRTV